MLTITIWSLTVLHANWMVTILPRSTAVITTGAVGSRKTSFPTIVFVSSPFFPKNPREVQRARCYQQPSRSRLLLTSVLSIIAFSSHSPHSPHTGFLRVTSKITLIAATAQTTAAMRITLELSINFLMFYYHYTPLLPFCQVLVPVQIICPLRNL